jgi:hypothetical protein
MRVAVWPADEGGCGSYRLIWPAQALAAQGADIDLRLPGEGSGVHALFVEQDGIDRLVDLQEPPDADVVVVQRPLAAWRADAVEALQRHGVRVVVEIDDCFETIHPRNVSWRSTHPRHSPGMNREHLARACRAADLVTVTTTALAHRYGRHGRVAVVPNCVPARYLDIDAKPGAGALAVGWTGSIDTHPTDLQVTRGAVERALDGQIDGRWPARIPFCVVGTGKGVRQALGLSQDVLRSGWVSLDAYPEQMAEVGVGIVPLDDIAFNAAKSALKLMEFSALGVACVASPTPDNLRMHAEGCGLIAAKPKHWTAQLRRLIADEGHRAEVAGRSREAMRRWTIEGNADRWWDAWASCLDREAAA